MSQLNGVVSGLQQRFEPTRAGQVVVWNFRLERHDAAGKPMPRVAVEMRGRRFSGSINNGDIVELDGSPNRDGLVCVWWVRNRTSNVRVTVDPGWPLRWAPLVVGTVLVILFLGYMAGVFR